MTMQQIFDTIVRYAMTQVERCTGKSGMCQYRSGDNKCWVGALIPDELYDECIEDCSAFVMRRLIEGASHSWNTGYRVFHSILTQIGIRPEHMRLLEKMQDIHDDRTNWENNRENMIRELFEVAKKFELDSVVVVEAENAFNT